MTGHPVSEVSENATSSLSATRPPLLSFFLRHLPLLILLGMLAAFNLRTVNVYLLSDDIKWVERTVADASQPWNAFGESLFGSYYRPMAHLPWLASYYLWGFNFAGYHVMYLGAWLIVVALVYALGCRISGRLGGLTAAAIVGFNDVYLLVASWKSWYTTVIEMAAVLAWAYFYMGWLRHRKRRDLIAWIIFAGIATISREIAPLVISAGILVTAILPAFERKENGQREIQRTLIKLSTWLIATVAVLALLPSYRNAAENILHPQSKTPVIAAKQAPKEVSLEYIPDRLRTHTQKMLSFGITRYLILFTILYELAQRFGWRARLGKRYGPVFLGMLVIGTIILALPAGPRPTSGSWTASLANEARFWMDIALLLGFVIAGLFGEKTSRFLAAWFAAAYAPAMVLLHASNAYHMLAFVALAFAVAMAVERFADEEFLPLFQNRLRDKKDGPSEAWRPVTAVFVLALLLGQAWFLARNTNLVGPTIRERIAAGIARRTQVDAAVTGILKDSADTRKVWTPESGYARIAALILRGNHGFAIHVLPPTDRVVGLRTFESSLPIYSEIITYDDDLFRRVNVFPNPSFEQVMQGLPTGEHARTGNHALEARHETTDLVNRRITTSPFALRPGAGYVFGGFLTKTHGECQALHMELRSAEGNAYSVSTQNFRAPDNEWQLAWACASPPEGVGKLVLAPIVVEDLSEGTVCADDIFFCPVTALMDEARKER